MIFYVDIFQNKYSKVNKIMNDFKILNNYHIFH